MQRPRRREKEGEKKALERKGNECCMTLRRRNTREMRERKMREEKLGTRSS